jgi:hypothetical protein
MLPLIIPPPKKKNVENTCNNYNENTVGRLLEAEDDVARFHENDVEAPSEMIGLHTFLAFCKALSLSFFFVEATLYHREASKGFQDILHGNYGLYWSLGGSV